MNFLSVSITWIALVLVGRKTIPKELPKLTKNEVLTSACTSLASLCIHGLLLLGVRDIHKISTHAADEAHNGWASFVSMLTAGLLVCLWVLILSGIAQLLSTIFRDRLPAFSRRPFWAGSLRDFWCRWGVSYELIEPSFGEAVKRCAAIWVFALSVFKNLALPVYLWPVLWLALIAADQWLAARTGVHARIPRFFRSLVAGALFFLSMPLLYSPDLAYAWREWLHLFFQPADTVYSLFLDERLTTPQTNLLLWMSLICVVAWPGIEGWPERPRFVRPVFKGLSVAVVLFYLGFALSTAKSSEPEGPWRSLASWFHGVKRWFLSDGSRDVRLADDGWLYSRCDVERLTAKRTGKGYLPDMLELQKKLVPLGAQLLVVPVPDKVALYPEPLLAGKYHQPVLPIGYQARLKELKKAGVEVFDLTHDAWENRRTRPFYPAQDSMWTFDAMKEAAYRLAQHIRKVHPGVVLNETPLIDAQVMTRSDLGNLAKTLDGHLAADLWPEDSEDVVALRGLNGHESSPVLLIGGPLIQKFDLSQWSHGPDENMPAPDGKGAWRAAFPIQLGAQLGREIPTRFEEMKGIESDLENKKLVVWVVRMREL